MTMNEDNFSSHEFRLSQIEPVTSSGVAGSRDDRSGLPIVFPTNVFYEIKIFEILSE